MVVIIVWNLRFGEEVAIYAMRRRRVAKNGAWLERGVGILLINTTDGLDHADPERFRSHDPTSPHIVLAFALDVVLVTDRPR